MSASTWIDRAKHQIDLRRPAEPRAWIGIDFSSMNGPRRKRQLLPLLVLALVCALGVSALRIDLIRVRYAMSSALAEEKALIAEQRELIVRRRQLRDPVELAIQARERGFKPAKRILSLPEPRIGGSLLIRTASTLPDVSTGPPGSNSPQGWR